MNIKKSTLALAVVAASAMGVSQVASANIYAGSAIDITGLTVVLTGASPDTRITGFQFDTVNTGTLNGVSATVGTGGNGQTTDFCAGLPGAAPFNDCGAAGNALRGTNVLDAGAANAPGASAPAFVRANNDFTLMGPGAGTYSNSDSVIKVAELTGGVPTSTQQVAESELQGSGNAVSSASISSSTGFVMRFTVAGTGELTIDFNADPYLHAYIDSLAFITGNATATLQTTFTLTEVNTNNDISWSPQGTGASNCTVNAGGGLAGAICTETADSYDLNQVLSVSSSPADNVFLSSALPPAAFGIDITDLADGTYTLAFTAFTKASVTQRVPEPGMIALLGIGLMGLGYAGRSNRNASGRRAA